MLDVKIGFACWGIKEFDLMAEFYCGGVCVVVVLFFFVHGNPEKSWCYWESRQALFLVRGMFLRPMGTALTDLLSKLVCSETKGERESEIKRKDLNCCETWDITYVIFDWDWVLWSHSCDIMRVQKYDWLVLLTDRVEILQSQPLLWRLDPYVMLAGCDWWISIWSVKNTQDWRRFWKRFRVCFVFQSRVSTKTVVTIHNYQ